jgi:hypothetical protein
MLNTPIEEIPVPSPFAVLEFHFGRSIMLRGPQLSIAFLAAAWSILPATVRAEEAKELKPIATAKSKSRSASIGSFQLQKEGVVIRNAEELVALTRKAKSAKDAAIQKDMEAELTKLLKVDAIDWGKQAVLGVIGEGFDSLKTNGKVLTATFVPFKEPGGRAVPETPKILVLIEQFKGEVKFVKKK